MQAARLPYVCIRLGQCQPGQREEARSSAGTSLRPWEGGCGAMDLFKQRNACATQKMFVTATAPRMVP